MPRIIFCTVLSFLLSYPLLLNAMEIKSRYVTLQYDNRSVLISCNEKITLKEKPAANAQQSNIPTVEDKIRTKIDTIVERVETVMELFPVPLHFTIALLVDADAVAAVYTEKYGKSIKNSAFYSLSEDTIYISVKDLHNGMLVHEISHAITDNYFDFRLPYNVYELMAQFTEKHIAD